VSTSSHGSKLSFEEALSHSSHAVAYTTGQKTLISIYLLIFFIVVGSWLLPEWTPNKDKLTKYTWPIMLTTGWTQYWSLFCPDVRDQNYHLDMIIEYSDGTLKCYELPRMEKLDLYTKFQREKMRKLFYDNLAWPNYAQFRPSVARHLARANSDPSNQPVRITFIKNMVMTPPPEPKKWVYRDQLPFHVHKEILSSYRVQPSDLQSN
jgi:hypothetical protein